MEQLICKMCGGNELQKDDGVYVCQHCGCNYTIDTNEIVKYTNNSNADINIKDQIEKIKNNWIDIPFCNGETDNKIYAQITRIGHLEKDYYSNIQMKDVFTDGPGDYGCGYEMEIYNISGEKIKYFTVLSIAYNAVKDEIGTHVARFTGPVAPGEYRVLGTDRIWKNLLVSSAKIDSMMIEFFDGKKIVYSLVDIEQEPDNLDIIRFTRTDKIPHCQKNTPNKIYIAIDGVYHTEIDIDSVQLKDKYVKGRGNRDYGVIIEVMYLAGKSIKSITIFLQPMNSVNDKIGECVVITTGGPIDNGMRVERYFEIFKKKKPPVSGVKIEGFIVNFMDGTSEFYKESDISAKELANNSDASGGCYVATAVYGSYDCPQVWTLRRYRDYTLAETWYGRAFINTYYAISPTLVKWFGHTEWFKKMWKGKLDRMVANLNAEGVEDTPYEDRNW